MRQRRIHDHRPCGCHAQAPCRGGSSRWHLPVSDDDGGRIHGEHPVACVGLPVYLCDWVWCGRCQRRRNGVIADGYATRGGNHRVTARVGQRVTDGGSDGRIVPRECCNRLIIKLAPLHCIGGDPHHRWTTKCECINDAINEAVHHGVACVGIEAIPMDGTLCPTGNQNYINGFDGVQVDVHTHGLPINGANVVNVTDNERQQGLLTAEPDGVYPRVRCAMIECVACTADEPVCHGNVLAWGIELRKPWCVRFENIMPDSFHVAGIGT
ncbi:MAG: hypothetical protein RL076_2189 [Chloroflexota bacterium]